MADSLLSDLLDKRVVSTDGRDLGTIANVLIKPTTGTVVDLVIDQGDESLYGLDLSIDTDGRYRCPADRIQAVRHHIIVEV